MMANIASLMEEITGAAGEIADLTAALEAAQAENERLRAQLAHANGLVEAYRPGHEAHHQQRRGHA